jgi:hypothetical protein
MQIKILALLLLVSCGKYASVSSSLLAQQSVMTEEQLLATMLDGELKRGTTDQLIHKNKTYTISPQSSYLALNYVNSKSTGTNVQVKFKAVFKSSDAYIEIIQDK